MPTSTLKTLRQKILKKLHSPHHPITSTTTSIGTTTALNDTVLAPSGQMEDFVNSWIYITELVSSGPAVGEISRVTNVDFTSTTSQLILAPAFSNSVQTGTDYEIHRKFHPVRIVEKLNEILENLKHDLWVPLTVVPDGDMQTTGTGDWAVSSSTLTKTTTGDSIVFGTQSLKVTNTGANGYAELAVALNYQPGTKLFVAALVNKASGSGDPTLDFFNVVTSGVIETGSVDTLLSGNAIISFLVEVPAGCYAQQLHLKGTSADNIVDWNFLMVLPVKQKQFTFPSRLEWSDDLQGLYKLDLGTDITYDTSENAYMLSETIMEKWGEATFRREDTSNLPLVVERRDIKEIDRMLFVKGRVDYSTFSTSGSSADAETTFAPEDILVDLVYAELLDEWAQEDRALDKLEIAIAKEKKAEIVRMKLGPRMRDFVKDRGIVQGTIRRQYGER